MGEVGTMDVIMNIAIDNILGLRTPTRRGREIISKSKYRTLYYKCEGKGHWSQTYCIPKHLVEFY